MKTTLKSQASVPQHGAGANSDASQGRVEMSGARRVQRCLSRCLRAVAHANDEQSAWEAVSQVLVELGGYTMCWVGSVDRSDGKRVAAVATAGLDDGYVDSLDITWADTERGRGPTGTAVRAMSAQVCRNMVIDADYSPWRARATKRGFASSVAVPVIVAGKPESVLNIYSTQVDAFDEPEVAMLAALADGLAVGIETLRAKLHSSRLPAQHQASAECYRALLGTGPCAFVTATAEGRIINANDRAEQLTGRSMSELEVVHIADLFIGGRHGAAAIRTALAEGRAGLQLAPMDLHLRHSDGSIRQVEMRLASHADPSGTVIEHRMLLTDRTEQRRVVAGQRLAELRLKAVFDAVPEHMMLLDRQHRIRMASRAETRFTHEELIGRAAHDLVPLKERSQALFHLDRALATRQQQNWQTRFERADGSTTYFGSVAIPIVINSRVTGCIVSTRNITHQIRLHNKTARLERQLQHVQRLEGVGRLTTGVAHDFNNVLCAISGYVQLIMEDLPADHALRSDLREIGASVQRGSNLTKQILSYSRREPEVPMNIDVGRIVNSMYHMLSRLIGETVTLRIADCTDQSVVLADAGSIDQILTNLVINAADALPHGGTIDVEVRNIEFDSTELDVVGSYARLRVRDDGMGMTAEVVERIWEPFYTTKGPESGTGVGLAMVYQLAEQCGGWVEVESEPEHGSTFDVYLPRSAGVLVEGQPKQEHSITGGKGTILIVEDNHAVRRLAHRALTRAGYNVLEAARPTAAMAAIELVNGEVDLVLMDVVLPEASGTEFAAAVRERCPDVRVLFTSGYDAHIVRAHGITDAGVSFLPKPWSVHALTSRVRDLLEP